jgi:transposase-like protein
MSKYIISRFRKRIEKKACPICGCTKSKCYGGYTDYPEIYWTRQCENCDQILELQDNSPIISLYDWIGNIKSKNKILKIVDAFNYL